MIKEFNNKGLISFEGDLKNLNLDNIPGLINGEQEPLIRATSHPKLDFVILPLKDETTPLILNELNEKDHLVHEGIIHVQIAQNNKLVFGGYDNFHKNCVVAYEDVPINLLEKLKSIGVIRSYEQISA